MSIGQRRFGSHLANCEVRNGVLVCESVNGEEEPVIVTDSKIVKKFLIRRVVELIYHMKPRRN